MDFGFKVECPSDFDCTTTSVCPPRILPAPLIDYLAKDYGSFRPLMLDRMAVTCPAGRRRMRPTWGSPWWRSWPMPPITSVTTRTPSPRRRTWAPRGSRISVRRHAVLLDYAMHDGCNARDLGIHPGGRLRHEPTAARSQHRRAGNRIADPYEPPHGEHQRGAGAIALTLRALVFETLHDVTLHASAQ